MKTAFNGVRFAGREDALGMLVEVVSDLRKHSAKLRRETKGYSHESRAIRYQAEKLEEAFDLLNQ